METGSEPVVEPGEGGHVAGSEAGDLVLVCVAVIHRFAPAAGTSSRSAAPLPGSRAGPIFVSLFFAGRLSAPVRGVGRPQEGLF
jgi:hypothetical protein